MVELYEFGLRFIETMGEIGDFFFETNLAQFTLLTNLLGLSGAFSLPFVSLLWGYLEEFTMAEVILGAGLPFMLVWKFIKFFVDMVL